MTRYRTLFATIPACLAAGAAVAQMPTAKVVVEQARTLDAPATITLVATVRPVRESRVASEIAGIVADMPVREGDRVDAGGVVCTLNSDALSLRHAQAVGRLEALKARHAELVAGTRPEDLERLKALADEAAAELDRSTAELQRVTNLYAADDSNTKELYDTRADFLVAKHRKRAADAAYALAVAGERKEVIAQAAHDVAEQQAIVDRAAGDLAKTVIRAPFAGHVVARAVEVGEWVPVGGTVVELVDLQTVLVRVDAPESALPFIHVGDTARVRIDALHHTVTGTIRHVIRRADPRARTFPVDIEVVSADGRLAPGMFARATLPCGAAAPVVAVPKDAVVERDGVAYVGMIVPGRRGGSAGVLMPVTLGADVGDWVAVTSRNVEPGAYVVTRGNEMILPFPNPVDVVDAHGSPVHLALTAGAAAPGGAGHGGSDTARHRDGDRAEPGGG
ncbi:MAG: efflux RND transporter periplasmic adaptor subunit [Phycisphaerae bacterium]